MKVLHQLWADEAGFVVSTELVLVATILVIGMVVGLATVRDAVVQELADVGAAIGSINQSYVYSEVSGHSAATAGSEYQDQTDFCDTGDDVADVAPQCVIIDGDAGDYDEDTNPDMNAG
jgi:Flp pilus assembly pilin Flp